MKELLQEIAKGQQSFVELRYHKRTTHNFVAQKGRVDVAHYGQSEGVGVRAFIDGFWGFAATNDLSRKAIEAAVREAQNNARLLSKQNKTFAIPQLARSRLAIMDFEGPGVKEMMLMPLSDKLAKVIELEQGLQKAAHSIQSARCRYNEIIEEKAIVTNDGVAASLKLVQPEISLTAIAETNGETQSATRGAGVNGGWNCLFNHPSLEEAVASTANLAVDLIRAKYPEGGKKTVILAPAVVGLLCHEAVGHTVEADFVKSGSVAQGMIGQRVASPLVSMADSGVPLYGDFAAGNLPFDDEGVLTETTTIIKDGVLNSYLHNRLSAAEFGVAPTGNARAWQYNDEPLIRMRNTYIMPGQHKLAAMIASIDDGYLVEGGGSGQADSNGEFMFGCTHLWEIKNGKKTRLLREATLSGIAFDVLKTVDAVSEEFQWDLGTGYCGKGQAAKVDAGGPYIKCRIHVGGR